MNLNVSNINLDISKKNILFNINADFKDSILNGIIGVNGSGKSMFLKSILGITNAFGDVKYNDEKLNPIDYSYISQTVNLETEYTVYEVILLGLYQNLSWKIDEETLTKVDNIIKKLDLELISNRSFSSLSGGQKQMVLLAQALVKSPKLIFADEPTSALDISNQIEYMKILKDYTYKNKCITIIVLHDLSLMSRFIDYFYVIEEGQIVLEGENKNIIKKEVLEGVYNVKVDVTETLNSYKSILPIDTL